MPCCMLCNLDPVIVSRCAPLVTTPNTQQTFFFNIFLLPCTFLLHIFWLQKNDFFRTVSEPMIYALDNYYIILNITILFWIQINFYADKIFLDLLKWHRNGSSDSMAIVSGFVRGPWYVAFSSLGHVRNRGLWDLLHPTNLHTGRLQSLHHCSEHPALKHHRYCSW